MLGVEIHKTIITVLPEKYQSTLFPAKNINVLIGFTQLNEKQIQKSEI